MVASILLSAAHIRPLFFTFFGGGPTPPGARHVTPALATSHRRHAGVGGARPGRPGREGGFGPVCKPANYGRWSGVHVIAGGRSLDRS